MGKISKKLMTAAVLVAFVTGLLVPLLPAPVAAAPNLPSTPNPNFPTFQGLSSGVNAIGVGPDGSTYVGGSFTCLAETAVINSAKLDTSVGLPSLTAEPNDTVNTSVADGQNGWYIAGEFTEVGGITRNRIAHILADGTVDPDFDPNVNGIVNALVLSSDKSTLYAGGEFSTVNGSETRPKFAAFSTSDGIATALGSGIPWSPIIYSLALSPDNTTLYVGGWLTAPINPGPTPTFRGGIAAFDIATGALDSFNPGIGSTVFTMQLSSDGTVIYAGGNFSEVNGGTDRNRLAAFDTTTGLATDFDPNIDGDVKTLKLSGDGNTLYLGGFFTTINGSVARAEVAAVNATTGIATAFDRSSGGGGFVYSLELSEDGTILYASGSFDWSTPERERVSVAAMNAITGNFTSYAPLVSNASLPGSVYTISLSQDGETLYAGGDFNKVCVSRRNLVRILPDGSIDPILNINIVPAAITSMAITPDNTTLYIGGYFTSVDGVTRNHLAAINLETSELTGFNPNLNSHPVDLLVSPDGSTLFAAGFFGTVNGSSRNYFASFNIADGTLNSLNPGTVAPILALAISPDGSTLYVGGYFPFWSPEPRSYLAAINPVTGDLTSFDPQLNSPVNTLVLSPDGSTLYAGGGFTTVNNGAVSRNRVAAFNTATGLVTDLDPDVGDGQVNALAVSTDGAELYVGGTFTTVNGDTPRNRLAGFSTATGLATDFDPNMDNTVNALAFNNLQNSLYVGGVFTSPVNYAACFGECVYTPPVPPVPPMPPTPGGGGSGSGDLAPTGLDMRILYGLVILLIGGAAGAAYVSRRLGPSGA